MNPLPHADAGSKSRLKAGMIGLDTSHVPAFTKLFNEAPAEDPLSRIQMVAGFPGGTQLPMSRERVAGFTQEIEGMGVKIVGSISELLEAVDVVLLTSVDGQAHLREAAQVFESRKPVFIDKPLAGSLADALRIQLLAENAKVPWFSCSSTRFTAENRALLHNPALGELTGATSWGPCSYQRHMPDLFFYGIHGIEALFALMGPGCESVSRVQTSSADTVVGVWRDGKTGVYRGNLTGCADYGMTAFGTTGILHSNGAPSYEALCREIADFFTTGTPPVSPAQTIEIFAFMEAADASRQRNGAPVQLEEMLQAARAQTHAPTQDPGN